MKSSTATWSDTSAALASFQAIKEAQESYVADLIAHDPIGAEPVNRFKYAPSWNAADAHGMQESYLPWLDKNERKQPCC